jgi:hypothetical protein
MIDNVHVDQDGPFSESVVNGKGGACSISYPQPLHIIGFLQIPEALPFVGTC